MSKNSLLIKIILIFVLPASGILFFSTKLVIEKFEHFNGVNQTLDKIKYMKHTQNLIHHIQKERGLSVVYLESSNFKEQLNKERILVDNSFKNYIKYSKDFLSKNIDNNVEVLIKNIQNYFYQFENIRIDINKKNLNTSEIVSFYSNINENLLNSIFSIKTLKSTFPFNKNYLNLYHFLIYKEYNGLLRALISKIIINKNIDKNLENRIKEIKIIKDNSINYFKLNSSIKFQDIYNENLAYNLSKRLYQLENKIVIEKKYNFGLVNWWNLSTKKIDKLNVIFNKMILELNIMAKKADREAFLDKNMSLFYLFVSFVTLVSLLFILKSIILSEQKNFEKIKKQKKVYELLNQANKYLLKKTNKKELYSQIHKIISQNPSMVFSFIYDLNSSNQNDSIYALNGRLKDVLLEKLKNIDLLDKNNNLLSRVLEVKKNILIEDFSQSNFSIFSEYREKFDINSAAAFPIKEFDEIVSILFIYSSETNFFDYEVEILFDQLVLDLEHTLEKNDYEALRIEQEKRLKTVSVAFESSEPMLITDENADIIEVNQAFCEVMKYSKDKLIGENPSIFKSLRQNKEFYEQMWNRLEKEDSWSGEIYNKKGDGILLPVRLTITVIRNEKNKVTNYLGQYIDISEIKNREQVLEYKATHDNLTNLPNRYLLFDRIERAIAKVVRHKNIGGLIFIDLDNFKKVNDTLGHNTGDVLLIEIAKKLKSIVREEDTVSRLGGDEFIILIDFIGETKDIARKNIMVLAKKIKNSLNEIKDINGHENISTPSIGITLFDQNSIDIKDIIKQADTAMYVAKKQGKNSIEFFN